MLRGRVAFMQRLLRVDEPHACGARVGTCVYDGSVYVKDVFQRFVHAGESVACDDVVCQCAPHIDSHLVLRSCSR